MPSGSTPTGHSHEQEWRKIRHQYPFLLETLLPTPLILGQAFQAMRAHRRQPDPFDDAPALSEGRGEAIPFAVEPLLVRADEFLVYEPAVSLRRLLYPPERLHGRLAAQVARRRQRTKEQLIPDAAGSRLEDAPVVMEEEGHDSVLALRWRVQPDTP